MAVWSVLAEGVAAEVLWSALVLRLVLRLVVVAVKAWRAASAGAWTAAGSCLVWESTPWQQIAVQVIHECPWGITVSPQVGCPAFAGSLTQC